MIKKFKLTGLALLAMAMVMGVTALLPAPASAAPLPACVTVEITRGSSRGDCVYYIQVILNNIGDARDWIGYKRLVTDGDFGSRTEAQVKYYQMVYDGLAPDGRVGPKTWESMCRVVKSHWYGYDGGFVNYMYDGRIMRYAGDVAWDTRYVASYAGCAKWDTFHNL